MDLFFQEWLFLLEYFIYMTILRILIGVLSFALLHRAGRRVPLEERFFRVLKKQQQQQQSERERGEGKEQNRQNTPDALSS